MSAGKQCRDIHALMQDPNDQDAAVFDNVDDQMLLIGMDSNRRIELLPLGSQHRCVRQKPG